MQIIDFKEVRKNSLLGFAKVQTPSGFAFTDVCILNGQNGPWVSMPSKPMIDKDSAVMLDASGKIRYSPVIEFSSREVRNRFSDAVIAAMRAAYPDVFGVA